MILFVEPEPTTETLDPRCKATLPDGSLCGGVDAHRPACPENEFAEHWRPAARTHDADSSVEAEAAVTRKGTRAKQCSLILGLIRANYVAAQPIFKYHPELSFTAGELAHLASRWSGKFAALGSTVDEIHVSICRRLPDLESQGENGQPSPVYRDRDGGKVATRRCEARGKTAQMWWRR